MSDQALLPDPSSLHLLHLEAEGNVITLVVRTTATEASCSLCGSPSTKVHSRYTRLLADLPWRGMPSVSSSLSDASSARMLTASARSLQNSFPG